MRALRRQAIVQCRRDHQFNNRAAAPAIVDAIAIGLVHIRKAGAKDYSGGVMIAGSR